MSDEIPSNPPPAGGGQSIPGTAAAIVAKRGPGRPPGSAKGGGVPLAKNKIQGQNVDPGAGPPAPPPPVDKELIANSVASLCSVANSVLCNSLRRVAERVTADAKWSAGFALDAGMKTEEREQISGLAAEVCAKHNILGQWAPELLLLVTLGGYGGRIALAFSDLEKLRVAKQQNAGPDPDPGPPK